MVTLHLCLILMSMWTKGSAIICYNCIFVDNPLHCNITKQCLLNEVCTVTETIDDSFSFKYRLGCVNPMNCDAVVQNGKRSLSQQCCARDNCNRGFPGSLTTKVTAAATSPTTSTVPTSRETTTTKLTTTTASQPIVTSHLTKAPTSHHHHHHKHSTTVTTTTITPSSTDHTTHQHNQHNQNNHNNDGACNQENLVKYHHHLYYSSELHGRQRLTKQEAREACKMCHMELVSIHSGDELTFVHSHLANKNEIWIGLEHGAWTDGSRHNFFYWRHPEDANEPCIVMDTNSSWQADNCYRTHLYVCKSKR
ncbi:lymphocyte antigen 75-like [Saccostrea cucullata]|uniref:lymphocyte antigen 75-like n=1 Tax=Saccostrea cuccullata TaxID=36930 RepID=UPI002ED188CF